MPGLDAPAAVLGRVANLRVGQKVDAIGSPRGLDLTLSDGLVSSLRETPDGPQIQTSAPISPGSSGGGLFTEDGQLVGIVTYHAGLRRRWQPGTARWRAAAERTLPMA